MGQIRSTKDTTGSIINGTTLGFPVTLEDGSFLWDGAVPTGEINGTGEILSINVPVEESKPERGTKKEASSIRIEAPKDMELVAKRAAQVADSKRITKKKER